MIKNSKITYTEYRIHSRISRIKVSTQNVESRWSLLGGDRLRELRPYGVKMFPH